MRKKCKMSPGKFCSNRKLHTSSFQMAYENKANDTFNLRGVKEWVFAIFRKNGISCP